MIFEFNELGSVDLIPGAIYRGGDSKNPMRDDPISKIFKIDGCERGIGNQGGFRKTSKERNGKKVNGTIAFVVIVDNGKQEEWPNSFDENTGIFRYYGDNRVAGNNIFKTKNLGNKFLKDIFYKAYGSPEDRILIPPVFIFRSTGEGSDKQFIGVAIPGVNGKNMEESLELKIFFNKEGNFENYIANFTVLNIDKKVITRSWLKDLKCINSKISYNAPNEWQEFIANGVNFNNSSKQYYNELEIKENISINTKSEANRTVKVRITQSDFRKKLIDRDKKCVICGLNIQELLIASHIKPWSESNDYEKQDENNGLLLCANHDALFDKGYISFANQGKIIISDNIERNLYSMLNINDNVTIKLNEIQKKYMEYHNRYILKIYK